jgi:hypothetical protein
MKIDFDSERRETPVLNGVAILFHTSVSVESLMSSWLKPAAAGGANFRKGIQNNVFLLLQGVRGRRIFLQRSAPMPLDDTLRPKACSNLIHIPLLGMRVLKSIAARWIWILLA